MNPHAAALALIDQQQAAAREQLVRLANINSGSFNADGVRATAVALAALYAPLGAQAEWLEVAPYESTNDQGQRLQRPLGPALRLRQRPEAPLQVFFCGHLDTVFAANSPFQTARLIDDNTLNGQRGELTINPGYLHGGGALNVVPDLAVFKFNVRTAEPSDECWMQDQLDLLMTRLNHREGLRCELVGGFTRPPKVVDAQMQRLIDYVGDCGRQLGLGLQFKPTGGCCDGNNLAAYGLPNLDNMGVVGGDIHSDREWMRLDSLAERAKLSALLLLRLASGELSWP